MTTASGLTDVPLGGSSSVPAGPSPDRCQPKLRQEPGTTCEPYCTIESQAGHLTITAADPTTCATPSTPSTTANDPRTITRVLVRSCDGQLDGDLIAERFESADRVALRAEVQWPNSAMICEGTHLWAIRYFGKRGASAACQLLASENSVSGAPQVGHDGSRGKLIPYHRSTDSPSTPVSMGGTSA